MFGLAEPDDPYVADVQVWIDGKLDQTVKMPMRNTDRRVEPAWKYLLPEGPHTVRLVWTNPNQTTRSASTTSCITRRNLTTTAFIPI